MLDSEEGLLHVGQILLHLERGLLHVEQGLLNVRNCFPARGSLPYTVCPCEKHETPRDAPGLHAVRVLRTKMFWMGY